MKAEQAALPAQVLIDRFQGMVSISDPADIRVGQSQFQINVNTNRYGELTVRRGLREIAFDAE